MAGKVRSSLSFVRANMDLDEAFNFPIYVLVIPHKSFHELAVTIKNECLRDVFIIAQILFYKRIVGQAQRLLDSQLFGVGWDVRMVILAAHIQTNHLQSLRPVLFLKLDQVRRLLATRLAVCSIKIEND